MKRKGVKGSAHKQLLILQKGQLAVFGEQRDKASAMKRKGVKGSAHKQLLILQRGS